MQTDLDYLNQGLFTCFFPNTPSGEEAWREIALKTEGTGKIFSFHLKDTLKQLKSAGLVVGKTKKPTLTMKEMLNEIDQILNELGN